MKNKSILKKAIDKVFYDEIIEKAKYNEAKSKEITDLKFIFMEGPYHGFNVEDVIDVHPAYLLWYHNEGVFKFSPYIMNKVYHASHGLI